MSQQKWVPCGAEFIEGDVIRWHESVFQPKRYDRTQRVKIGERSITAQVLYDPADSKALMEVQVLASEGTRPYKPDELIRRARKTVSREDTERLAWSDEEARESVIASLPKANRRAMAQSRKMAATPTTAPSQQQTVPPVATGAPWRRRRKAVGAYAAKP